ncbi:MAG: hypothetical protein Q8R89_07610 [Desulfomicrobium sp.]|nr:hypothetical protein [Desulfomicrobium sp.]
MNEHLDAHCTGEVSEELKSERMALRSLVRGQHIDLSLLAPTLPLCRREKYS